MPAVEVDDGDVPAVPNRRRRLHLSRFGMDVEWTEEPFEWVQPQRFGVVRRYSRGPVREMRVLVDLAEQVWQGTPVDLAMGFVNVIWQGDANEQALRLLAHCTAPTSPINITGPSHTSIRWLASEFGAHFGRPPILTGSEAPTAWLVDTAASQKLFGAPGVPLATMIDWVADWVARGGASLGKPTHFEARDGQY